ncbi:MAG: UDP-glucose/GDP-mannose dehydrogenase family protein [Deltaproteobacteria bacterium]|nr:UDP-glucose/GDP-mannose dehydrogenase family protein [Deltaproteobacteria bacterium]
MDIAIVGTGYVGLVAGACFAETGNDVICVDIDQKKVEMLSQGGIPIYEPGLEDIVKRNLKNKRLSFTTSLQEAVQKSDVIFIAVGTPQDEDGAADLSHVLAAAESIGRSMNGPKIVVDKSTVPIGTAFKVRRTIMEQTQHPVEVVSNPEFLKEGAAIDDFMKPDRVVVGVSSEAAAKVMRELYAPFVRTNNPILVMDVPSAEMTKYAANAMLATRISFVNEIANLCEKVGADINSVRIGIGTDTRIGMSFLFPGVGYGGSCFPKDVQALIRTGMDYGIDMKIARVVEEVNEKQKTVMVQKVIKHFGRDSIYGCTFAMWGLAFKPKTDDVREAPAQVICRELIKLGAKLQVFDPEATQTFRKAFGESSKLKYCESEYDALDQADALLICTEWNQFRTPNFGRIKKLLKNAVIFDGRNIFNPAEMEAGGFVYYSIGRAAVGVPSVD